VAFSAILEGGCESLDLQNKQLQLMRIFSGAAKSRFCVDSFSVCSSAGAAFA
jgi:hypothetical protein